MVVSGADQIPESMGVDLKRSLLVEVAEPRLAVGETPSTGPTLRINLAKDGFSTLEGVTTLLQLWQRRCCALCALPVTGGDHSERFLDQTAPLEGLPRYLFSCQHEDRCEARAAFAACMDAIAAPLLL